MHILSAEDVRKWDAFTIEKEPIASIDLMERAAATCFDWLKDNYPNTNEYYIFCGPGNNGGDGLAIARMLHNKGINVHVFVSGDIKKASADQSVNLKKLQALKADVRTIDSADDLPIIENNAVVVDAIFGTGLNKPAEGINIDIINHINNSDADIISIDIPSGMFADKNSKEIAVVKAAHTLSFQCYKLAFIMAENENQIGKLHVLGIGLHEDFLDEQHTNFQLTEQEFVAGLVKLPRLHAHKGDFGHALLIGGSMGKMGAIVLSAKACLRSGAGLVSLAGVYHDMLSFVLPELMTESAELTAMILSRYSAIGIGPGWGPADDRRSLLHHILTLYSKPFVLDADALNCLAENNDLLKLVCPGSLLTPHPKEFDRLFGQSENEFERLDKAKEQAALYNFFIVLKGHHTAVVCPDGKVFFNSTGNPGMAKGGSGDVLTGLLTGLLARGYEPLDSALLGVYLHGSAGDIAAKEHSLHSVQAQDIIDNLGKAMLSLDPATGNVD